MLKGEKHNGSKVKFIVVVDLHGGIGDDGLAR